MAPGFPLQYILIILFSLVFWAFCFVILYHLVRFGVGTQPKKLAAVFLTGSVILFCITIIIWINIDLDSIGAGIHQLRNAVVKTK